MAKFFSPITNAIRGKSIGLLAAYSVAVLGVILIAVAAYYGYARSRSGSDADKFAYITADESLDSLLGRSAETSSINTKEGFDAIPLEQDVTDLATLASGYPGNLLNPKYWDDPEWAGSDPYGGPTIPDDFVPVLSNDLFPDFDPNSDARRIRIPSIGVNAPVEELGIVDLGDQQAYETPDNVVGHIPETSQPGQQWSGWFFAHLEGFASGEGNIFRHLPEIRDLITQDPVDVYLSTDSLEFIYRVTSTSQIHEDDLRLSSAEDAQITLVTCWPPRVYDQRISVDATLIAYRPL